MSSDYKIEPLFLAAKEFISQGFGVVPVRMVDEEIKGRIYKEKSPLFSFKQRKDEIKDNSKIFNWLTSKNIPLGIALVTGSMSKNLMCIDIDEKYNAGISKQYLSAIKEIYPELYSRLRIETTQNHGVHIPFFTDEPALGSEDLASRLPTEEEKKTDNKIKKFCFIETRGENATFITPPTKGYGFIQDKEIPKITASERDILINIARSFHEIEEKIVKIKTSRSRMRNYITNPFEDYNQTDEFLDVLQEAGWVALNSENNKIIHFTRPNGTKGEVHASWLKDKNIFYVFTAKQEFEQYRGYQPATVLAILKFNDDRKETFAWLVENGYGKYDEHYESKLIKKSIINNQNLPKNLSLKGKKEFEKRKNEFKEKYPYGIFWEEFEERGEIAYRINRELILRVARQFNYRLLDGDLILIDDNFIEKSSYNDFYNTLKSYVKEEEADQIKILDKFENYAQQSGKFLIKRLPEVEADKILYDTFNTNYMCFNNVILQITRHGIKEIKYEDNKKYIFKDKVLDWDFKFDKPRGLFLDFIERSVLNKKNIMQNIGYYLHEYNSSENAFFQIYCETTLNPLDGGGSGKDLMAKLIGMCTSYLNVSGSQIKSVDKNFFQAWNGESLYVVSDIDKDFPFLDVKNIVSNSAIVKKLYKDEVSIPIERLPKVLFTTNYSFDVKDGGVRRRLIWQEFTEFFTNAGGVDVFYKDKSFPRDWSDDDWCGYYNYMVNCAHVYIKNMKLSNVEMSETGWLKQFIQNNGEMTYEFIKENIDLFTDLEYVENSKFENIYSDFCNDNGIQLRYRKSAIKLNRALEDYCIKFDIEFKRSKSTRIDGITTSCRYFKDKNKESKINNFDLQDDDMPF